MQKPQLKLFRPRMQLAATITLSETTTGTPFITLAVEGETAMTYAYSANLVLLTQVPYRPTEKLLECIESLIKQSATQAAGGS